MAVPSNPSSGLYYYGFRYYSPNLGRWLSRDPIGERESLNLYGFVNNIPINKYDILGLCKVGDKTCETEVVLVKGGLSPDSAPVLITLLTIVEAYKYRPPSIPDAETDPIYNVARLLNNMQWGTVWTKTICKKCVKRCFLWNWIVGPKWVETKNTGWVKCNETIGHSIQPSPGTTRGVPKSKYKELMKKCKEAAKDKYEEE